LRKVLHMMIRSKVLLCLRCGDVEGPCEAYVVVIRRFGRTYGPILKIKMLDPSR